jgi:hypothetical protein
MLQYWSYTKYLIKHKFFVFYAGMKYFPSIHMFYRCIVHDLSKLSPLEFITYANCFYTQSGKSQYIETDAFNQAWNHHQKCNKHHWQYWQLKRDAGDVVNLKMPHIYVDEMLADWIGAGKAINGDWKNILKWFPANERKLYENVHPATLYRVRRFIDKIK